MQLSQSPERRRPVQLAGKCKRLCLSFGAALNQIETEWPTGTVWFGAGWINIKAIARGKPESDVDSEWGTLRAALR